MESRPRKTSRTLYGWLWTEILHMQPLQGVPVDYTQQISLSLFSVASLLIILLLRAPSKNIFWQLASLPWLWPLVLIRPWD